MPARPAYRVLFGVFARALLAAILTVPLVLSFAWFGLLQSEQHTPPSIAPLPHDLVVKPESTPITLRGGHHHVSLLFTADDFASNAQVMPGDVTDEDQVRDLALGAPFRWIRRRTYEHVTESFPSGVVTRTRLAKSTTSFHLPEFFGNLLVVGVATFLVIVLLPRAYGRVLRQAAMHDPTPPGFCARCGHARGTIPHGSPCPECGFQSERCDSG